MPHTMSVAARLRIGFEANPEFLELNDTDKKNFKTKVVTETKNQIDPLDLHKLNTDHSIIVDSTDGHADEAKIQAAVKAALDTLGAPGTPGTGSANIKLDHTSRVTYVVWNSTRECIHEYTLNIGPGATPPNWQVSNSYAGTGLVVVTLIVSFAWDWTV